ncbi:uncharacterized protein [Vicugna pacos]|uniref:POM121-like protein 1 n=1 Tax=Vicugna pacos TaxID=30538 RepID=A0ABM5DBI5_VICPA
MCAALGPCVSAAQGGSHRALCMCALFAHKVVEPRPSNRPNTVRLAFSSVDSERTALRALLSDRELTLTFPKCSMGDYLSTPCPSAPPRALGARPLPRGPGTLQPAPRHRRLPPAGPGHPALHQVLAARRPASRCPMTLHRRLVTALHRRCSLLPRTLRSFLGVLSCMWSRVHRRRAVLHAQTSTMSCSSASPVGTATVYLMQEQPITPALPTASGCALDSCGEAVSRAPGESGKELAKQREDLAVPEEEDQRSLDGTGDEQRKMRQLWVQRGPVSFVPRPGSLQANLDAKNSEHSCVEKPQTSCVSSCPERNAISSSYSSSRASPPVRRKRGPARSGLPPKSLKKGRKESPQPPAAAPVVSPWTNWPDRDADTARGPRGAEGNTSDGPRKPRRRRFPLLPRRRGEPLRLPPPPELGFQVTAEDVDMEKKAAFWQINSVLRGEAEAGLAPAPSPDAAVTPVETTPPSQPLFSGAPQTTSGSILPPLKAPQTAPSGALAFVTPTQGTGVTPVETSPSTQPLLSGAPQTTSGSILPPLKAPQMAHCGGLAVFTPASDSGVTPMDTTPPSQPLLSGAPQTTSGSILPPLQAPQTAPFGALAVFTPASDSGVTPMDTTPPSQPLLSGAPQTTSGSILPPLQAPQTAPFGALAVFTPASDSGVTPMDTTPPSQPLLSGAPQTTSGSILPPLQAPQTAPFGALAVFTPASDSGVTPMDTTPPSQPLLSGAPQTTSGSILPPLQAPQTAPFGALAVFTPASDSGVTPMDTTPPSQPLLSGAPQTTSGNILPPLQAPQTVPFGGVAFVTPAQGTGVTPMNSTVPSQPLLSGAPQTTSGSILPPLQGPQRAPHDGVAFVTPAQGTGVTPMNSTVPSQPLLSGAPQTTSGRILPPLQAPQRAPHDGVAFVILTASLSALSGCGPSLTVTLPANPGTSAQPVFVVPHGQQCGATTCDSSSQCGKQAVPAPTSDPLSTPGPLAFRAPPKASSDGLSSRNPTMGTHASTQPISPATSAVFPRGSAAAAYMPSVVTRAGPNTWRHCPRSTSSSPVPCRFGVSAARKGGRSQVGDFELCRLFAALSITREAKRSPSTTRCHGGRRGLNTWGPVHQSTPMLATGPSTKQQPGFGGSAAPILSPTPGGAPRQSPSASSRGPGTSPSKAGMALLLQRAQSQCSQSRWGNKNSKKKKKKDPSCTVSSVTALGSPLQSAGSRRSGSTRGWRGGWGRIRMCAALGPCVSAAQGGSHRALCMCALFAHKVVEPRPSNRPNTVRLAFSSVDSERTALRALLSDRELTLTFPKCSMGDYLSTPCPSAPPRALGARPLPRGPGTLQPAPRHRRLPPAGPGHPALHQVLAARRPASRCPMTLHRRLVTALHRRCSLLPRTLRSFLGVLSCMWSRVHRRRAVLHAQTSTMSCSSASPVGTATVYLMQEQPITPALPTASGCALDSCGEAVSRAPGESGKELAKQREDLAVPEEEDQRSLDGTGDEQRKMRQLWVQRGPVSFVPRPGSLQANLDAKNSEHSCVEKPQTSCVSSCPERNAISSSYSSSRASPPVRRKRGPARSGLPPKSLKKGRKESPQPPAAAPVVSPWTNWPDRDADTARGPRGAEGNTSDGPRKPRRRRFPLLPRRRGEPLRLPPPPELGFQVTAEDVDMEKKAAFWQINSVLRGEAEAGLAPAPSPDAAVTPVETTPPSQPLFSGAPQTTSGSILPPLKAPQTAPSGALAFVTPTQGTGVTPVETSPSTQPLLSGAPQTTSGSILPPLKAPQMAHCGGLAVFTPASDSGVTPMDTTPPSQPLLSGAPQTTSGSILPPLQAPQTAPFGALAVFTPASDSGVTPMDTTPPSQPLLSGAPQTTSGSILPPLQAPQTAPFGALAVFTPASDSGVTPMDTTPPSQPLLSGAPQTTSGSILPPLQAPQTAPFGALAVFTPASDSGVTPMDTTPPSQPLLSGAPQTTSGSILPPLQAPQTAPFGALAVFTPASDSGVTPMDTTPPSQPLLSGAPQTTSGNILPPLQAPQTVPFGGVAFVTPAQGTGVTPMNSTVPSQPLLSGAPQTTSGSILPPLQGPQRAPHDGVAFVTPAQGTGVTPMNSTVPSQPLLSGAPQTTSGRILPPLQAPQRAPHDGVAFVTPAQGTGVTPMNSTVPSQPLLSGAPQTTSGRILPPLQAPQRAPHDGVAFVILTASLSALSGCGPSLTVTLPANPGTSAQPVFVVPHGQQCGATTCDSSSQCGKQAVPAPTSDPLSTPGPLAFRAPPKASSDGLSSRNPTMGTHASTQPISPATSAVFPRGSAAAAYMPSVVTRAGPNTWRHCPRSTSSSPVPCRFGVSAARKGGRSQVGDFELCRLFAALSITREAKRSPSTTRCHGGRRGLNTWGPVHQSTPMLATGPSTKQQPGFGGSAAPILSPTPGGAPRQSPSASSRGPGTSPSKAGMALLLQRAQQ